MFVISTAVAGLALGLSACSGSSGSGGTSGSGNSVRVDGSSTVAPLTSAAAEAFKSQSPDINVTVGTSGTGGGFEKFCRGETDISDASRAIKDSEASQCAANNIKYSQLVVANDALTVVVPKANIWAKCLTIAQLKKIWEPNSKVTNWNQVDPAYPDVPLALFGPGTDSGTFDYFTKEINGAEDASRTDYTPSEDDNVIVKGVAGSKGGLGYFGFSYYEENAGQLNAVAVNSGSGCVTPSTQAVQDGTYKPLGRPLFVYPAVKSLSSNKAAASFLQYYVSNDAKIAKDAQFIPLSASQHTKLMAEYAAVLATAGLPAPTAS